MEAREMEQTELRNLQLNGLYLLKTLDAICKKYNIQYFALYGTALGAIRHNGFIPWDDDIDVGMIRHEYERLLAVPREEWGDCYLSDPADNDPAHDKIFPRVYLRGTKIITKEWLSRSRRCCITEENVLPIWLDIFVFDQVSSEDLFDKNYTISNRYRRRYFYSKFPVRFSAEKNMRHKLLFIYSLYFRYFSSPKKIYEEWKRKINSTGKYLGSYGPWEYNEGKATFFEEDKLFPLVTCKFEDITIYMVKNYDEMLKKMYGEYMQLPPVEKRKHYEIISLVYREFN